MAWLAGLTWDVFTCIGWKVTLCDLDDDDDDGRIAFSVAWVRGLQGHVIYTRIWQWHPVALRGVLLWALYSLNTIQCHWCCWCVLMMKAFLCCEPAQEVMRMGWNPVIIDNTNVQAWQMLPYVRLVCHSPHFLHSLLYALAIGYILLA